MVEAYPKHLPRWHQFHLTPALWQPYSAISVPLQWVSFFKRSVESHGHIEIRSWTSVYLNRDISGNKAGVFLQSRACIQKCIRTCTHTSRHACMHTHTRRHVCSHTHTHTSMYADTHKHVCSNTHACTPTCCGLLFFWVCLHAVQWGFLPPFFWCLTVVVTVFSEMARHYQGGAFPGSAEAQTHHRIQGLLPQGTHSMGKWSSEMLSYGECKKHPHSQNVLTVLWKRERDACILNATRMLRAK